MQYCSFIEVKKKNWKEQERNIILLLVHFTIIIIDFLEFWLFNVITNSQLLGVFIITCFLFCFVFYQAATNRQVLITSQVICSCQPKSKSPFVEVKKLTMVMMMTWLKLRKSIIQGDVITWSEPSLFFKFIIVQAADRQWEWYTGETYKGLTAGARHIDFSTSFQPIRFFTTLGQFALDPVWNECPLLFWPWGTLEIQSGSLGYTFFEFLA